MPEFNSYFIMSTYFQTTLPVVVNEYSRVHISGMDYGNQYRIAKKGDFPDVKPENSCDHIRQFVDDHRMLECHGSIPLSAEWHAERDGRFNGSQVAALLNKVSPFYPRGKNYFATENEMIEGRVARLVFKKTGQKIATAEKKPVFEAAVKHGQNCEALAVWVMEYVAQQTGRYVCGISHLGSYFHPELGDSTRFTPDYLVCFRSMNSEKSRCVDKDPKQHLLDQMCLVEVKSPFMRKFDAQNPTPQFLLPQVVLGGSALGLKHVALLQLWKEQAVYDPVPQSTFERCERELMRTLILAEEKAQLLAEAYVMLPDQETEDLVYQDPAPEDTHL